MKKQTTNDTQIVQTEPAPKAGPASTAVFVVDKNDKPLMPCHPRRARLMLKSKRADVFCMSPFTIRILDREGGDLQKLELKIDPGSKATGIALVVKGALRGWFCIAAWELSHRGQQIVKFLLSRSALRHGRRNRKARYRPARFLNRTRPVGWLPPSLLSRLGNVEAFCKKVKRVAPLSSLAVEDVRFDTQLMQNSNISGVEYQQGTLAGYEVREYLLLKWQHKCSYCQKEDVPLQIDHITPKIVGGTNRISNLCLACEACNQKKGTKSVQQFLKKRPDLLKLILSQAKASLKDAAAVNTTRVALVKILRYFGLPVETGTGGRTKFNRIQQNYAKSHWLDAVCVGQTGAKVDVSRITHITLIKAKGRGSRRMCHSDKYGFPDGGPKSVKRLHGFQTGDRVRLTQPNGKYRGVHEGVVAIRADGRFDLKSNNKKITASYTRFSLLSRFDGYTYSHRKAN